MNKILRDLILDFMNTYKQYVNGNFNREKSYTSVQSIYNLYLNKKIDMSNENNKKLGFILFLLIERMKKMILLEDELLTAFDLEINTFYENIAQILNGEIFHGGENIEDKLSCENKIEKNYNYEKKLFKRSNYPKKVTHFFKKWLAKNKHNPYPTDLEKSYFAEKTGLDINQINNWFVNARRRFLSLKDKKTKQINMNCAFKNKNYM